MDSMYMTAFRVFLALQKVFEILFSTGVFVTNRLVAASRPREFVFFKEYAVPYPAHIVKTVGPGIPSVAWYYNMDTNRLTYDSDDSFKSVPWLSARIQYNGMNLYSLDDFISEVKYSSSGSNAPSPAVLVGAWSLQSGIVLDNKANLELCVITELGEIDVFSPWSFTPINLTQYVALPPSPIPLEPLFVESNGDTRAVASEPFEEQLNNLLPLDEYEMPELN